jgi:alpha-galactosidase
MARFSSLSRPMNAMRRRQRTRLAGSLAALLSAGILLQSSAAAPTRTEFRLRDRWVAQHFGTRHGTPPFAFTCGGFPASELLPSWKLERTRAKPQPGQAQRTLAYTDLATGLHVRCDITEHNDFPAVEWVLHIENRGSQDTPILERILPLDAEFKTAAQANVVVHHSVGEKNSWQSYAPVEDILAPGSKELVFAPLGGRSSDGQMPFFNLAWGDGGVAMAIGWSGQWEARILRSTPGALIARAGQQLVHCTLHPGESIRTPRILLVFWAGREPIRGNNLMRKVLMAHYLPRRNGELVLAPICASVNWTASDGSYEEPHVSVMQPLAQRGIEVFWSDMDPQQWYPKGFPEGTGTWEPDLAKYPRGLKPIGDAARAAGLDYLLWFEPERVHPGTRIDREHPEWVMPPQNEWSKLFRLHDPQARRWLTDYIDAQISAGQLRWLRWDFNIEPLGFWRRNDAPDRQGITEIRHVEGLYAMWDDLRARHPGLVIDLCASGGRRIDLESLTRGLPLWHSDMQCTGKPSLSADQLQNAGLWRWVPMHGCGNFAYEPAYAFRSAMTAGNILAPGNAQGRLSTADPATEAAVRRTVAIYRKLRPYMVGDFYPLCPHNDSEEVWFGYQFHRSDLDAGAAILFRRDKSKDAKMPVLLHAVAPKRAYAVSFEDTPETRTLSGNALSALPVEIPGAPGSAIVYYHARRGLPGGKLAPK